MCWLPRAEATFGTQKMCFFRRVILVEYCEEAACEGRAVLELDPEITGTFYFRDRRAIVRPGDETTRHRTCNG